MVEHPGLLDALATLSLLPGVTDYEVESCAISAIERLSKEASTRHIMVRNSGIMTALTTATFAKDDAQDDEPEEGTPTALLMNLMTDSKKSLCLFRRRHHQQQAQNQLWGTR